MSEAPARLAARDGEIAERSAPIPRVVRLRAREAARSDGGQHVWPTARSAPQVKIIPARSAISAPVNPEAAIVENVSIPIDRAAMYLHSDFDLTDR